MRGTTARLGSVLADRIDGVEDTVSADGIVPAVPFVELTRLLQRNRILSSWRSSSNICSWILAAPATFSGSVKTVGVCPCQFVDADAKERVMDPCLEQRFKNAEIKLLKTLIFVLIVH